MVTGNWNTSVWVRKQGQRFNVKRIVEGPPGVLWIGTEQGLFRRSRDGKVEHFTEKDGLPHPHVRDILKDSDGTIWTATGVGLCRLASDAQAGQSIVARAYSKKDGLPGEAIFGSISYINRTVMARYRERAIRVFSRPITGWRSLPELHSRTRA